MKLFKSHDPNLFHYRITFTLIQCAPVFVTTRPIGNGRVIGHISLMSPAVPIEIDWRGYWKEDELKGIVETVGNARL